MRRRRFVGALSLAVPALGMPALASAAIVDAGPAAARVRHRQSWTALQALVGRRLSDTKPDGTLRGDFRRLLGKRYDRFMAGLGEEVPMRRMGDAILGEGVRAGTLGHEASLFVLARDGSVFAVVKGGAFGGDIETFGSKTALREWDARHRYLEFVDLDE